MRGESRSRKEVNEPGETVLVKEDDVHNEEEGERTGYPQTDILKPFLQLSRTFHETSGSTIPKEELFIHSSDV